MKAAIGHALLGAALLPFLMGGCGGGDESAGPESVVVRKEIPDRPTEVVKPAPSPPPEAPGGSAGTEPPASADEAPAVVFDEPPTPDPDAVPEPSLPEETPPAEPEPPVVAEADTPPAETPEEETSAPAMDDEAETVDDSVAAVADAPADEPEAAPSEPAPEMPAISEGEAAIAATPTEEEIAAAEADVMGDSAIASIINLGRDVEDDGEYSPSGRLDPFEPLFKPEPPPEEEPEEPPPEPETAEGQPKPERRVPRTPLERMDLGQLKLVGIIRAESGDRALVEEASGKGYIIKEGTYIGIHSGQVAEILYDRIIVEEKTEDVYGEASYRTRELKLQKPPGERS